MRLIHGDCLAVLPTLPDNSVDLILTDPPYFSTGKASVGDRQWRTAADYLAWLGVLCGEWHRLLKPNGSLYCFASPEMSDRVSVTIRERFNVLNTITWRKEEGRHKVACKEGLRGWFPASERIVFAEHYGADNIAKGEAGYEAKCDQLRGFVFEPLRAYFDGERLRAGLSSNQIQEGMFRLTGVRYTFDRHTFSRSQWELPTQQQYEAARTLFNARGGAFLRREYEDLRREYEDLRRPFSVTAQVPYTDVWDFPTV